LTPHKISTKLRFSQRTMKLFITAYKTPTCWVFDHEHQNTRDEALCNGTETVIDWYYEVVEGRPASVGDEINFYLNTDKFVEATTQINLIETDSAGSYYMDQFSQMKLWLCPWLQGYFGEVPQRLYIQCSSVDKTMSEEELDDIMEYIHK